MKKMISVIICIVLLSYIIMPSITVSAASLGDIDGNGKVVASDARKVLRHSAKLEILPDSLLGVADVNFDKKITASDARTILRVSAKIEQFRTDGDAIIGTADVVDFGAYGDGVHDDTRAIQNALDSMKEYGGTIYFPDGEYVISACLIFYSEQELFFGDNAVLKRAANATPVKYMLASFTDSDTGEYNGVRNTKIIGGKFDGNSEVASNLTIINLCHANNVTISDAEFVNGSFWHYIEMASCKNITVENCSFDSESYTLFRKDLTDELIQIDVAKGGNYGPVYNLDGEHINFKKDEVPCSDIYIKGCTFNCSNGPAVGEHNGYPHSDIFIVNNEFNGIVGNSSVSNGYVKFMSGATGVEVYNNTFISTADDTIKNKGIVCLNSNTDTNKAYNNVFAGYFSQYFSDNIVAENNIFN